MITLEVQHGELIEGLTKQAAHAGITHGAIVSLIGAVESFTLSTMPADNAKADVVTDYSQPAEMSGTGDQASPGMTFSVCCRVPLRSRSSANTTPRQACCGQNSSRALLRQSSPRAHAHARFSTRPGACWLILPIVHATTRRSASGAAAEARHRAKASPPGPEGSWRTPAISSQAIWDRKCLVPFWSWLTG